MDTEPHDRHVTKIFFTSTSTDEETFQVIRFKGEEAISRPYRFAIDLVSDDPDIDMDRMVGMPARLTIERDGDRRHIHGVLETFEQGDEAKSGRYYYHAVLVPRLRLMTLSRQNQIYQNQSVPEIIREELLASQNKGASAGITSEDFELRLTRQYARREYVVQYAESDFNFISRLMEHEGLFYFFEQKEGREKMIITDNNIHLKPIAYDGHLTYRPASGMTPDGAFAIRAFTSKRRRIPGQLVLKDYNYRLPHLPLQAETEVDPASHGMVCSYGDNFKVPEEGQALAKVRSQEILARKTIFQGQSDCIHFQSADKFNLDDHFRTAFNQEYILTAIHHEGSQMLSGVADQADGQKSESDYSNRFEAISAETAYRPERVTPKPKLYGIMNAHVDSALLEDRAEIDDQGRYKVVMPFDISGPAGGKATRYIRMAQPYGGQNQGMHFPLRKNTEVIWTCIDGDPDRPIIIGAVPNPMTPSVVNSDNHTRNIIKTSHGSFLEFNDGRGNGASSGQSPTAKANRLLQQQNHQHLSRESKPERAEPQPAPQSEPDLYYGRLPSDSHTAAFPSGTRHLSRQQQLQPANDTYGESQSGDGHDVWFRVNVPHYAETRDKDDNVEFTYDSYLRIGHKPADETPLMTYEDYLKPDNTDKKGYILPKADNPDGWLDYTDGNHTSIARGNRKLLTGGDRTEVVNGTYNLSIAEGGMDVYDAQAFYNVYWHKLGGTWIKRELQYLNEMNFTTGTSYNMFAGSKIDANVATSLEANIGLTADIGAVIQYENVLGPMIHVSEDAETKAHKTILMRVDPEELTSGAKYGYEALKVLGILAGVVAAGGITTAFAEGASALKFEEDAGRLTGLAGSITGAVAAAYIAHVMNKRITKRKEKMLGTERYSSMIKMDQDNIEIDNKAGAGKKEVIAIKCGDSAITLHADGRIIIEGKNISLNGTQSINATSQKQINILADKTGDTKIGGKEVIIESAAKTTLASKIKTVIEANAGVDVGGPDTAGAKIQQAQVAAKKYLTVPPSKKMPKKTSMPPKKG